MRKSGDWRELGTCASIWGSFFPFFFSFFPLLLFAIALRRWVTLRGLGGLCFLPCWVLARTLGLELVVLAR